MNLTTKIPLEVLGLKTYYFTNRGLLKAVDGVTFEVKPRETLGLAGESGCGKSTTALSIMRLVPAPGRIVEGKILVNGGDIVKKSEPEMREIRWGRIAMVFQEAMSALNPVFKIEDQIAEAIIYKEKVTKAEALGRARTLLESVGIGISRGKDYPHEFSGGMRQRAMIAMALACNPEILILDEPSTALDVMVNAQILDLIKNIQRKLDISILMITHDLSIIAEECDRVAIMYAGKIVELANVLPLFDHALHPYTMALTKAFPSIKGPKTRLEDIPGSPPHLINPPTGCAFHPRCPYARELCRSEMPELVEVKENHHVACHLADKFT